MRKLLIIIALLFLGITTNSWAAFVDYNTGTLAKDSGLLVGSDDWKKANLIWDVNQGTDLDSGTWQYEYTFATGTSGNNKRATYLGIETLMGFKIADPNKNLISWLATPAMNAPTLVTLPSGPYGIQWYLTAAGDSIKLTLVTNTKPMWGDVYVGGQNTNYANNSGYGSNNPNSTDGSQIYNGQHFALVPTPIPAAAWMLGTGLIGLVAIRRRRK